MINIIIIICAQIERSFVSTFFVVTTHLLLLTPTMAVKKRLCWDQCILVMNFAILVAIVVYKHSMDQHPLGDDQKEQRNLFYSYMSYGFVVKWDDKGWGFRTLPFYSYKVETFIGLVYIIALLQVKRYQGDYDKLCANQKDILVIKYFDLCS